jgi:hypothetical protein
MVMASRNAWQTGRAVARITALVMTPGMVVDPGDDLHFAAVSEERAGGDLQLP